MRLPWLLSALLAGLGACLPAVCAPAAATAARCETAWSCEGVARIVAVGDVHGALAEFTSILRAAGIIDDAGNWAGGESFLVSTGDLIDRGPESLAVIELLRRLETEAQAAGGRVLVTLGNHEEMNLIGDLRYLVAADYAAFASKEAAAGEGAAGEGAAAASRLPPGWRARQQAFSPDGDIGQWLLARPLMVRVNGVLFTHGGLPPTLAGTSLEELNTSSLHRDLVDYAVTWHALIAAGLLDADTDDAARVALAKERLAARAGADRERLAALVATLERTDASPVLGIAGPLWYRGSAMCHSAFETDTVSSVLAQLEAGSVVIGHTITTTRRITTRMADRVTMIDTGMLPEYRGQPSALVIEGDARGVIYARAPGERAVPEREARRVGERPGGLTDDQLEEFLHHADVVANEAPPPERAGARLLTLRRGDLRLRALFITAPPAGRWQHEVAAYRLDRLLGIDMVPVTVERRIDGEAGALQFWIEKAASAAIVERDRIRLPGWCSLESQYGLMRAFDALAGFAGRRSENVLLGREDGLARLVDFAAAFSSARGLDRRVAQPPVGAELARRLATLDAAKLAESLSPWLGRAQQRAILARRDALLAGR
ncbi:MAG TPA: metallophosphoesterase [Steroidobacteraceae bacterium]|nr:metallophosphoesterase [Steroidobacteraceae bacterium]HNS27222.1 metallophosphoesterase [Steroidobacteraceae bacterium]